jgi:OmpA-OmpF porin, OOP family
MKAKFIVVLLFLVFKNLAPSAQILNPAKVLQNKVINKTNRVIDKKAGQVVDSVFGPTNPPKPTVSNKPAPVNNPPVQARAKTDTGYKPLPSNPPSLQSYSRFDFVPGEKVLFYDDFSSENIGDFPVLWNTTGSGEIMTNNLYEGRWFKITNARGVVTLMDPLLLPENYTIEFDVIPQGDPKNGNNKSFGFWILSTTKPKDLIYGLARPGESGVHFSFEYSNYYSAYYRDGTPDIKGSEDQPKLQANKKYRISVWVQKERIRLYVDETKLFDLPKVMNKSYKYNMVRFNGGTPMIANFRVATGLPDMRSKLITEGRLVSYGIYFDVNKDVVKPESYATLKGIADVLNENPGVRIKIVGHTDSDGRDDANLDLSRRRAASVKNELARTFGIDASRMETDGMGESKPVAPNDSPSNKALNRRVEFIKL